MMIISLLTLRPCGHQMCAHCTLALCCHKKPDPITTCATGPAYPFCRGPILQLIVSKFKTSCETEPESSPTKPRRSRNSNFSEGSRASRVCQPWAHSERLLATVQERLRPKSSEGIAQHQ
ncbi:hypothetical protein PIB30_052253 [Stylosanthes scabra]|uniref:Secreted protein n=1 Tax=Stylosanthes scabra TaxID=79078 RepID=A0ABU6UHL4_9FABA|nr:hypothetical protein [Stylosanthes scabra]